MAQQTCFIPTCNIEMLLCYYRQALSTLNRIDSTLRSQECYISNWGVIYFAIIHIGKHSLEKVSGANVPHYALLYIFKFLTCALHCINTCMCKKIAQNYYFHMCLISLHIYAEMKSIPFTCSSLSKLRKIKWKNMNLVIILNLSLYHILSWTFNNLL